LFLRETLADLQDRLPVVIEKSGENLFLVSGDGRPISFLHKGTIQAMHKCDAGLTSNA
jgi:hypothetical protein